MACDRRLDRISTAVSDRIAGCIHQSSFILDIIEIDLIIGRKIDQADLVF